MSLKLNNRLKKHFKHEKQLNRQQVYSSELAIQFRRSSTKFHKGSEKQSERDTMSSLVVGLTRHLSRVRVNCDCAKKLVICLNQSTALSLVCYTARRCNARPFTSMSRVRIRSQRTRLPIGRRRSTKAEIKVWPYYPEELH